MVCISLQIRIKSSSEDRCLVETILITTACILSTESCPAMPAIETCPSTVMLSDFAHGTCWRFQARLLNSRWPIFFREACSRAASPVNSGDPKLASHLRFSLGRIPFGDQQQEGLQCYQTWMRYL